MRACVFGPLCRMISNMIPAVCTLQTRPIRCAEIVTSLSWFFNVCFFSTAASMLNILLQSGSVPSTRCVCNNGYVCNDEARTVGNCAEGSGSTVHCIAAPPTAAPTAAPTFEPTASPTATPTAGADEGCHDYSVSGGKCNPRTVDGGLADCVSINQCELVYLALCVE